MVVVMVMAAVEVVVLVVVVTGGDFSEWRETGGKEKVGKEL